MIKVDGHFKRSYQNATGRWSAVGPYYAMFPIEFAFDVVERHSQKGDWILDPFAGRYSSIYAAATQERYGLGLEIHPVGWVYGQAKLHTASKSDVESRLKELIHRSRWFGERSRRVLPEFFEHCYSPRILSFLLTARNDLNWREDEVDATLMAFILIDLHAKEGSGLSNQMRQSKAMAPDYSIRWWKDHNKTPPNHDPVEFIQKKINWRYKKGIPQTNDCNVILGDSMQHLEIVAQKVTAGEQEPFSLLLTSPPYYDITHYHYDQWLRLWMLGGESRPTKKEDENRGRFSSKNHYEQLLDTVFEHSAKLMAEQATIYVRTGAREFTLNTTRKVLKRHFPMGEWEMYETVRPFEKKTQTTLFGDFAPKPGEVDLILQRS